MTQPDSKIFNTNRNYISQNLFLGDDFGLFDTVNKQHPEIWSLYKGLKQLDWDENEFDYSSCNNDFKTCDPSTYEMMIRTLAFQWEADSIASRSIIGVVAPFITSTELSAAWTLVSANEGIHAGAYSEIVRNSFDNPHEVLDNILEVKESIVRLGTVTRLMADVYKVAHEYALGIRQNDQETYNYAFLFPAIMYLLERIQFMASFAVTFTICDTGRFMPIGKAVQKIAQDELEIHVELDKAIMINELKTPRGRIAYQAMNPIIEEALNEVVQAELDWVDYLFSEGRQLVGMTAGLLKKWVLYNAKEVYEFFGFASPYDLPSTNPLPFMNTWLNISKTQPAPQEEDVAAYKVNIIKRTDDHKEYDIDF